MSIFIFLITFLVSMALLHVLQKFSEKRHFLVDVPEGDALKIHHTNIPLIGGIAIAVSLLIGILFVGELSKVVSFTLAFLIVFFLGFWDDLKWKHVVTTKPLLKFALLIVCTLVPAIILSMGGIGFNFLSYAISLILGFVYIFIVINAVNYQDGIDGLAGSLVFISLIGFSVVSIIVYNNFALGISLAALGSVVAFLFFNFPPAKVFMGDSGAYSLGFILAVVAMAVSTPVTISSIVGPLLIIGVPIIDGVFTNIRRIAKGKSIFLGDRDHFYDRLRIGGFSVKKTILICAAIQCALVFAGVIIYLYGTTTI